MNKQKEVKKNCYVCGMILDDYPYDDIYLIPNPAIICPCCGIHYGYDDDGGGEIIPDDLTCADWRFGDETHKKIIKFWRKYWINNGMKWWSVDNPFHAKPKNWNPEEQINNIPEEFKD